MKQLIAILLALSLLVALAAPAVAQPARGGLLQDIPVTGNLDIGGTFEGTLSITEITHVNGALQVRGLLNGVATPTVGEPFELVDEPFTAPASLSAGTDGPGQGQGVCPILFLELGPLFLDLLGLVIEIPDPIVLDVRAERGPGRLLGNLLCALVGILDGDRGGPPLDELIDRINALL